MTREETKVLLKLIADAFPNFKPSNPSGTVDIWAAMLNDYEFQEMVTALKIFIATDTSGFAPTVGQLLSKYQTSEHLNRLQPLEAWSLVSKALRDSAYNYKERYEELPAEVQKAVGSPENLHAWGIDPQYNEGVMQSNFIRTYNNVLKQQEEYAKLPKDVRAVIEQTKNKMIGATK